MLGHVVLEYALLEFQGFDLFGLFVLSQCDECVMAGQNVFLWPTILFSLSGLFPRVSWIAFKSRYELFVSDAFWKEVVTLTVSPRSEFTVILVSSRSEDAFMI